MAFYMRDYASEEKFDISKFMMYNEGVYDVVDSPFLNQLHQLSIVRYYYVDNGYKDVDIIAAQVYGDPFYAYLIQYYNNDFRETFPDGTVLKLFSKDDLNELYYDMASKSNLEGE